MQNSLTTSQHETKPLNEEQKAEIRRIVEHVPNWKKEIYDPLVKQYSVDSRAVYKYGYDYKRKMRGGLKLKVCEHPHEILDKVIAGDQDVDLNLAVRVLIDMIDGNNTASLNVVSDQSSIICNIDEDETALSEAAEDVKEESTQKESIEGQKEGSESTDSEKHRLASCNNERDVSEANYGIQKTHFLLHQQNDGFMLHQENFSMLDIDDHISTHEDPFHLPSMQDVPDNWFHTLNGWEYDDFENKEYGMFSSSSPSIFDSRACRLWN